MRTVLARTARAVGALYVVAGMVTSGFAPKVGVLMFLIPVLVLVVGLFVFMLAVWVWHGVPTFPGDTGPR